MPPYNTRSAARKRALERAQDPYKNATAKGTNVRLTQTPDEVPTLVASKTLESEPSLDRPVTPDQDDEDEEFQRSPTTCSTDLPDEPSSPIASGPIVTDDRYKAADKALAERMFADLQRHKRVAEDRLQHYRTLQVESNRPAGPRAKIRSLPGPRLPVGVVSFGRTGTWVNEDVWRPNPTPSTDQLPSIREIGETQEEEVQNLLASKIIREDVGDGAGVFRMLTPLPSFVTGNGVTQTR